MESLYRFQARVENVHQTNKLNDERQRRKWSRASTIPPVLGKVIKENHKSLEEILEASKQH